MDKSPDNQRSVTCHPWVNESVLHELSCWLSPSEVTKENHSTDATNKAHKSCATYLTSGIQCLSHFKSRSRWCKCTCAPVKPSFMVVEVGVSFFSSGFQLNWWCCYSSYIVCKTICYMHGALQCTTSLQQKRYGNEINELSMHKNQPSIHCSFNTSTSNWSRLSKSLDVLFIIDTGRPEKQQEQQRLSPRSLGRWRSLSPKCK